MKYKDYKYILIACLIIVYGIYMIYCQESHDEIVNNGRYTIAKVTDFKTNFRNGYTVYFQYQVSGITYNEKMPISKNYDNIINHRFFAKYNPDNPEHCYIIMERPTSATVEEAPANGWEIMPN